MFFVVNTRYCKRKSIMKFEIKKKNSFLSTNEEYRNNLSFVKTAAAWSTCCQSL